MVTIYRNPVPYILAILLSIQLLVPQVQAQVERIVEIQKTIPTLTAINMSNPWLIDKIEPNAAAIISTFGVKTESLVDVIRGKFNPTGRLPFTIPANQEAVNNEVGDIPGYDEDPTYTYRDKNGNRYVYNF